MPQSSATSTKSNKGPIAIGAAGLAALVSAFVMQHEGLILRTYADPVGIPTACVGATGPEIRYGQTYTIAECVAILDADLQDTWNRLKPCIQKDVNLFQAMSLVSFAFNVGVPATCGSTMVRMLNEGAPATVWCDHMKNWHYAKGKSLPGLVRRRAAERAMCLTQ